MFSRFSKSLATIRSDCLAADAQGVPGSRVRIPEDADNRSASLASPSEGGVYLPPRSRFLKALWPGPRFGAACPFRHPYRAMPVRQPACPREWVGHLPPRDPEQPPSVCCWIRVTITVTIAWQTSQRQGGLCGSACRHGCLLQGLSRFGEAFGAEEAFSEAPDAVKHCQSRYHWKQSRTQRR